MRVAYVDVGGLWERRGGAENDTEVLYLCTGCGNIPMQQCHCNHTFTLPHDASHILTSTITDRYPDNPADMAEYYKAAPVGVIRVSPSTLPATVTVDGAYYTRADTHFATRGTGESESAPATTVTTDASSKNKTYTPTGAWTKQALEGYLDDLGKAIDQKHGGKSGSAGTSLKASGTGKESPFNPPFFVTGLDCVDEGTECNGDCPDTLCEYNLYE